MSRAATVALVLISFATSSLAQKEQFSRSKPHANVGVLGDSTDVPLAAAIAATWAADGRRVQPPLAQIVGSPRALSRGITINTSHVEYDAEVRHHVLLDGIDDQGTIKNMVTGAAQMDGAILVVSADGGPTAQTREHVLLARQVGVPSMTVLLTDVERVGDPALLDLVELEVRDILVTNGFDGSATPIIRGSALGALDRDTASLQAIRDLVGAVDARLPPPTPPAGAPFLMAVEHVGSARGGTVATGRIETGHVAAGDVVEVVGGPAGIVLVVVTVEEQPPVANAGGNRVTRIVLDAMPGDVEPGDVLAAPGTMAAHHEVTALVVDTRPGPAFTPLVPGTYTFEVRRAVVQGDVSLVPGPPDEPEGVQRLRLFFSEPIALSEGTGLSIREGGHTVGAGQVIEILD